METNKTDKGYTNNPIKDQERLEKIINTAPDSTLPYEDPAITNPEELATFPDAAPIADAEDVEEESKTRIVNVKSSPVRDGRNIIRTDTNSNTTDGFM